MSGVHDLFQPRSADWTAESGAHAIIDAAIAQYNPSHVFALFSGGHDSLCSTHVAAQHPRFSGAITVFTSIGLARTRRYVYDTCKGYGWPLKIYRPEIADRYATTVRAYGFPGPAQHSRMYRHLKQEQIRRALREHKLHRNDRIMFVTGVRAAESSRRMNANIAPIDKRGVAIWVQPIVEWEASDKREYMERHALPRNPVVDLLCMSGECLCGAFAQPGEMASLELHFPREAAELHRLEDEARARGLPCVWGERPLKQWPIDEEQCAMDLCYSCNAKQAARST